MTILALDQATKHTGFAIFSEGKLIDYGVLNADQDLPIFARMNEMRLMIAELVDNLCPDIVVFEQVQYQQNQKVYSQLSQLQGFVMSALFQKDVPFYIVEPVVWKSFAGVKGKKRAEQKESTIALAKLIYKVAVSEDTADAIFIGHWAVSNYKEKQV